MNSIETSDSNVEVQFKRDHTNYQVDECDDG